MTSRWRFDTNALHAGQRPDPATGARAPPIYQTTSYVFDDADTAAARYAHEDDGHIYSRISNPTVETLEARIATLHDGTGAVATASGLAALDTVTTTLCSAGDSVVSANALYGGTRAYLTHTAGDRGIDARFVDTIDYEAYADAIDDSTAFVHLETIGNPALDTPDIARVADIAHDHDVPLVVDNTFATPFLCNPIEHGADVVWSSTTKWLTGAGTTVGGVVVDGGSFPWRDGEYPKITGGTGAFNGLDFAARYGDTAFAETARQRGPRAIGNQQSPVDAWLTLQGVETLPLRMARHCENAAIVAEYLDEHDAVEWVRYPGLASHPTHENASRYLDGGYGGMLAFGLRGGYDAARRFCETVDLASFLANVGDAKTLVIHPASTTHAQLTESEQRESGVTPDLIRVSVGIEDPADVVADVDRAIEAVVA